MAQTRRTLIVDDERLARSRMRRLLEVYEEVEIVGESKSVSGAVKIVEDDSPDLIFLDIQMPGGSGLDLFEACEINADVVLVTAHHQHAIAAFEKGAVDYLLKPVAPERLAVTMQRLGQLGVRNKSPQSINMSDRISVISPGGLEVVSLKDIACINGADDYSEVFLRKGGSRLSLRRLAEWESRLEGASFFRIHRSSIVNIHYLESIERSGKAHFAVVKGVAKRLPIARRRVRDLKEYLSQK